MKIYTTFNGTVCSNPITGIGFKVTRNFHLKVFLVLNREEIFAKKIKSGWESQDLSCVCYEIWKALKEIAEFEEVEIGDCPRFMQFLQNLALLYK